MAEDNAMKRVFALVGDAMEKIQRPFPTKSVLKARLEKAGFVDVQEVVIKQIFGPWPKNKRLKNAGAMALLSNETGIEAYGMAALTRILEMDKEEAAKIVKEGIEAGRNKNMHMYTHL